MRAVKRKVLAVSVVVTAFLLTFLSSCGRVDVETSSGETTLTDGGQSSAAEVVSDTALPEEPEETGDNMIYAHIGERTLAIKPESNSSAEAFAELLAEGDAAVDMHDYGGFEKVGSLGTSLPTNDENITTQPGDVILYQGNQITIYYGTNTWSFTRLGKVQGMTGEELEEVLGDAPTVIFSLK